MRNIAFVGAGAVGGYVGAAMASRGHDVTLIDPWPEQVERIRRRIQARLADEAIRIGLALGYRLESIRGIGAQTWLAAAANEPGALAEVESAMMADARRKTAEGRSGTAQDLAKAGAPRSIS